MLPSVRPERPAPQRMQFLDVISAAAGVLPRPVWEARSGAGHLGSLRASGTGTGGRLISTVAHVAILAGLTGRNAARTYCSGRRVRRWNGSGARAAPPRAGTGRGAPGQRRRPDPGRVRRAGARTHPPAPRRVPARDGGRAVRPHRGGSARRPGRWRSTWAAARSRCSARRQSGSAVTWGCGLPPRPVEGCSLPGSVGSRPRCPRPQRLARIDRTPRAA